MGSRQTDVNRSHAGKLNDVRHKYVGTPGEKREERENDFSESGNMKVISGMTTGNIVGTKRRF